MTALDGTLRPDLVPVAHELRRPLRHTVRELAVGLIVDSGMGTPFGDMRILRIGGVVLDCVRSVSGRDGGANARVVAAATPLEAAS